MRLRSLPLYVEAPLPSGVFRDAYGVPVLNLPATRRYPPLWIIAALVALALYALRRLYVIRYLRRKYSRPNLSSDIGEFYDLRSSAWESVWGEHMHHGLYDTVDGHRLKGVQAQMRTMDELFNLGSIQLPASRALDVGCGIGGGSRFLASRSEHVTALTLSPEQASRADTLNTEAGLSERIQTHVADVLRYQGLPAKSFDIVWALESAEHISPKQLLAQTTWRLLRPGGTLLMVAWCHRESTPPFTLSEKYALRRIMEEYCLPPLASPSEYSTELTRAGFRNVKMEDWTDRAAPFWGEVARSAVLDARGWKALREHGWPLVRSALAMRHVMKGIRLGAFRLVAFSGKVPTEEEAEEEKGRSIAC